MIWFPYCGNLNQVPLGICVDSVGAKDVQNWTGDISGGVVPEPPDSKADFMPSAEF